MYKSEKLKIWNFEIFKSLKLRNLWIFEIFESLKYLNLWNFEIFENDLNIFQAGPYRIVNILFYKEIMTKTTWPLTSRLHATTDQ